VPLVLFYFQLFWFVFPGPLLYSLHLLKLQPQTSDVTTAPEKTTEWNSFFPSAAVIAKRHTSMHLLLQSRPSYLRIARITPLTRALSHVDHIIIIIIIVNLYRVPIWTVSQYYIEVINTYWYLFIFVLLVRGVVSFLKSFINQPAENHQRDGVVLTARPTSGPHTGQLQSTLNIIRRQCCNE